VSKITKYSTLTILALSLVHFIKLLGTQATLIECFQLFELDVKEKIDGSFEND
jgi:hypothetical protein